LLTPLAQSPCASHAPPPVVSKRFHALDLSEYASLSAAPDKIEPHPLAVMRRVVNQKLLHLSKQLYPSNSEVSNFNKTRSKSMFPLNFCNQG